MSASKKWNFNSFLKRFIALVFPAFILVFFQNCDQPAFDRLTGDNSDLYNLDNPFVVSSYFDDLTNPNDDEEEPEDNGTPGDPEVPEDPSDDMDDIPDIDDIVPPHINGIAWQAPIPIGSTNLHIGYFSHNFPWVPDGHTVPPFQRTDTTNNFNINNPGLYPVAYQVPKTIPENGKYFLEAYLHPYGNGSPYCEGPGGYASQFISVRNCNSDYPHDVISGTGMGWWAFSGGMNGASKATNADSERVAESLLSVLDLYKNKIDEGAGFTLRGQSYGGVGVILMSMNIPRIQHRISVVNAMVPGTLFLRSSQYKSKSVQDAWGDVDRDTVDFEKQAPKGKVNHIFYRLGGASNDGSVLFDLDFFRICNDNRIACFGTWNMGNHSAYEPEIKIPHHLFWNNNITPDVNMVVRLDKILPVFTNSTANNWNGRGHYNLGLSWNTSGIVDVSNKVEIPLKYKAFKDLSTDQVNKPVPDMPNKVNFSVTVRRNKNFTTPEGTVVNWTLGGQSGTAIANSINEVTIHGLELDTSDTVYTKLILTK